MHSKIERRIFNNNIHEDKSYSELKQLLEVEGRKQNKQALKEALQNKIFAKTIFAFCILLNIVFITLGVLNYTGVLTNGS